MQHSPFLAELDANDPYGLTSVVLLMALGLVHVTTGFGLSVQRRLMRKYVSPTLRRWLAEPLDTSRSQQSSGEEDEEDKAQGNIDDDAFSDESSHRSLDSSQEYETLQDYPRNSRPKNNLIKAYSVKSFDSNLFDGKNYFAIVWAYPAILLPLGMFHYVDGRPFTCLYISAVIAMHTINIRRKSREGVMLAVYFSMAIQTASFYTTKLNALQPIRRALLVRTICGLTSTESLIESACCLLYTTFGLCVTHHSWDPMYTAFVIIAVVLAPVHLSSMRGVVFNMLNKSSSLQKSRREQRRSKQPTEENRTKAMAMGRNDSESLTMSPIMGVAAILSVPATVIMFSSSRKIDMSAPVKLIKFIGVVQLGLAVVMLRRVYFSSGKNVMGELERNSLMRLRQMDHPASSTMSPLLITWFLTTLVLARSYIEYMIFGNSSLTELLDDNTFLSASLMLFVPLAMSFLLFKLGRTQVYARCSSRIFGDPSSRYQIGHTAANSESSRLVLLSIHAIASVWTNEELTILLLCTSRVILAFESDQEISIFLARSLFVTGLSLVAPASSKLLTLTLVTSSASTLFGVWASFLRDTANQMIEIDLAASAYLDHAIKQKFVGTGSAIEHALSTPGLPESMHTMLSDALMETYFGHDSCHIDALSRSGMRTGVIVGLTEHRRMSAVLDEWKAKYKSAIQQLLFRGLSAEKFIRHSEITQIVNNNQLNPVLEAKWELVRLVVSKILNGKRNVGLEVELEPMDTTIEQKSPFWDQFQARTQGSSVTTVIVRITIRRALTTARAPSHAKSTDSHRSSTFSHTSNQIQRQSLPRDVDINRDERSSSKMDAPKTSPQLWNPAAWFANDVSKAAHSRSHKRVVSLRTQEDTIRLAWFANRAFGGLINYTREKGKVELLFPAKVCLTDADSMWSNENSTSNMMYPGPGASSFASPAGSNLRGLGTSSDFGGSSSVGSKSLYSPISSNSRSLDPTHPSALMTSHLQSHQSSVDSVFSPGNSKSMSPGISRSLSLDSANSKRSLNAGLVVALLDDVAVVRLSTLRLLRTNFSISSSSFARGASFAEARDFAKECVERDPDLVILDLYLEYDNEMMLGTNVAADLRELGYTGCVVLTSANAVAKTTVDYKIIDSFLEKKLFNKTTVEAALIVGMEKAARRKAEFALLKTANTFA